jgi:hypothetical protein
MHQPHPHQAVYAGLSTGCLVSQIAVNLGCKAETAGYSNDLSGGLGSFVTG